MSCSNQITKKTTENLYFNCIYKKDGVAISVDDFSIKSSIKNIADNTLRDGVVVKIGSIGEFTVDYGFASTGLYLVDILFIKGTIVVASDTFTISVIDPITT